MNGYEGPFPLSLKADSITQARWLQGWVKASAEDMALAQSAGVDLKEPSGEAFVILASIGCAERINVPRETAIAAGKAAWRQALQTVRNLGEEIRRAVWPMAKMRAPGHEIIAAAQRVCDRSGVFVPTDVLTDLCRRIALATVPTHVRSK